MSNSRNLADLKPAAGGLLPSTSMAAGSAVANIGYTPTNKAGDTMTGALTATGFTGPLTGNAATATNVAYSGLTGTVPTWNQDTTGNAATATNVAYSGLTGTVPTWNQNTTGNAATATTTTGNAATATALVTGRTIALTGDVTYTSPSFTGAANVTAAATLAASGVTAGTYGSASAIPAITVDAKGRVTSVSTNAVSGGVSSLNGQTGAITNTAVGDIGSYLIASDGVNMFNRGGTFGAGDTIAGSSLRYWTTAPVNSFSNSSDGPTGTGVTGTWRRMSRTIAYNYGSTSYTPSLWVRIS